MKKSIKITEWIVPDMNSDDLRKTLKTTKNQKLAKCIQKELDRRRACGVDRPLTLEDWL